MNDIALSIATIILLCIVIYLLLISIYTYVTMLLRYKREIDNIIEKDAEKEMEHLKK